MKKIFLLLSASFLLMACPPESIEPPIYNKDYGKGLYILTENGVNFYDFDEGVLKEDIYSTVNGGSLQNPSSLNIHGNKMYIVTKNTFHKVDAETFLSEFSIPGFTDAQQCENAYFNRFYVTDKAESEIKIIDLISRDISGRISTGDSVFPTDIVVNGSRAFVINSGGDNFLNYDSTIVTIDIRNGEEMLNNFTGNIITGRNPSSVVNDGNIIVLCKGIYDESNTSNNEESSLLRIRAGNLNIYENTILSGIYNADNLCIDESDTKFYFTASDGVYFSDKSSFSVNLITNKKSPNVLISNNETYFDLTDSINKTVNYLWCNDQDTPNYLYKLNFQTNEFEDSIIFNSPIIDLEIYR
ncbi:MAG: hypothetical protein CMP60_02820 [Flavobacteriales bacterium]|nr:hypothetical protein [Flavobacteriales bacterium]